MSQTRTVTLIGGPAHLRQEVISEGQDRRIRVPTFARAPYVGFGYESAMPEAFEVADYRVYPFQNPVGETFYIGLYEGRTYYSHEDWRARAERAEAKLREAKKEVNDAANAITRL